jgi:ACS family tartrate transporter-like MFS transporter
VQFYTARFFLGLAEAGFFPGVIVFLTHWFPSRDRARALSLFLIATPFAQVISPKISNVLLKIGTTEIIDGVSVIHPRLLGMAGWQWVYVFWATPAILLGVVNYFWLTDRPMQAAWLDQEESQALEAELVRERAVASAGRHMTVREALSHPRVLLLALAFFGTATGSIGIEFFLPSILQDWYQLKMDALTWLIVLPPLLAVFGQLLFGWSSDRFKERRWHAVVPIVMGAIALALAPGSQGRLGLTVACFMIAVAGLKSYMPAFWSLPSMFLTQAAAAASIGFINSAGQLGGFLGPYLLGAVQTRTGSFVGALYYLCGSMLMSATIIFFLGAKRKPATANVTIRE